MATQFGSGAGYETGHHRPRNVQGELIMEPFQPISRATYGMPGMTPDPWVSRGNVNAISSSGVSAHESWLAEALEALEEIDIEVAEENFPEIQEATKAEAEKLVRKLARHIGAPAPTLYPTQDSEVAIHFKSPDSPNTVVILLDNAGQAHCFAYTGGRSRRAHYTASSDLPDAFVLEQLRDLTPERADPLARSEGIDPFPMSFQTVLPPTR